MPCSFVSTSSAQLCQPSNLVGPQWSMLLRYNRNCTSAPVYNNDRGRHAGAGERLNSRSVTVLQSLRWKYRGLSSETGLKIVMVRDQQLAYRGKGNKVSRNVLFYTVHQHHPREPVPQSTKAKTIPTAVRAPAVLRVSEPAALVGEGEAGLEAELDVAVIDEDELGRAGLPASVCAAVLEVPAPVAFAVPEDAEAVPEDEPEEDLESDADEEPEADVASDFEALSVALADAEPDELADDELDPEFVPSTAATLGLEVKANCLNPSADVGLPSGVFPLSGLMENTMPLELRTLSNENTCRID
jgi:hypothetical protein